MSILNYFFLFLLPARSLSTRATSATISIMSYGYAFNELYLPFVGYLWATLSTLETFLDYNKVIFNFLFFLFLFFTRTVSIKTFTADSPLYSVAP